MKGESRSDVEGCLRPNQKAFLTSASVWIVSTRLDRQQALETDRQLLVLFNEKSFDPSE